jgi:hypothetical protein
MKAVSAPNFAEYEKLYAEALGRVKTKPQRQRLEMLGDVLTVMHFNLRNAGLVANPEASAFFKRDEDYRHFLKAPERVLGLSPEMLLDKDGRVPMLFTPEKRTLNVVSLAGKQPPRIDGDLSDDAWGGAEATGEFRLRGARAPAGQQTQVRAAFDSTALYVAVACREKDAARIQKRCDTADSVAIFSDDVVEVFLGHRPNFEQTYWHVALNPGGGRYDAVSMEKDYNLKFEGAAKVGDDGWTVEVAIPFASLGLQGPPLGQTWRVNVCRQRRPDPVEYSTWSAIEAHFHEPANFGYWVFPPK